MSKKVMIVGAGGVGRVVSYKCAEMSDVFSEIVLASRNIGKCKDIQKEILERKNVNILTCEVDADDIDALTALLEKYQTDIVINVALPYQDLSIMEACLNTNTHYLDTANYEPPNEAKFEYSWQWKYRDKFKKANLAAILGCGFDPGVTNAFCAHAQKHHFDEIHYIDIYDCNAGDHGYPFATNFNPEINIREITARGRYWQEGKWLEIDPLSHKVSWDYPTIGPRDSYLLYHEELESLALNIPHLKRIRFFMTFGESYLTHLKVLENLKLLSIDPVNYEGKEIVPLQFLKFLLPDPASLAKNYKGETCIGAVIKGTYKQKAKEIYIYNICNHESTYKETNSQAVSYTTGVPAAIGASLIAQGIWDKPGVYNIEELNVDPFMEALTQYGLPWHIKEL